jgi:hypothetical protein
MRKHSDSQHSGSHHADAHSESNYSSSKTGNDNDHSQDRDQYATTQYLENPSDANPIYQYTIVDESILVHTSRMNAYLAEFDDIMAEREG